MFGFLKRLTKRKEPEARPATPPPAPAPTAKPAGSALGSHRVSSVPSSAPKPSPASAAAPSAPSKPTPVAIPAPVSAPVASSGITIDLSLRAIWTKLNPEIVKGASKQPDAKAELKLPLELVQALLAKGAVRMPYAQFRKFAPEGLFPIAPEMEMLEVQLPLSDVLAKVKPGQLRRREQRKIEVPDEIGAIFGPDGAGLKVADGKPITPPAPAPKPQPAPKAPAPPPAEVAKKPESPKPVPPPPPAPKPTVSAPVPKSPVSPTAPVPAQKPAPPPPSEPIRAPKLDPALASLKPKPVEPAAKEDTFNIALMDMEAHWQSTGTTELANLYRHSLEIPMKTAEAALKAGKFIFPWREVRHWLRLAPGNSLPTIPDDLLVEFPLSVIAPKFMRERGLTRPKKRVEVSDEIPDLFSNKAAAQAEPVVSPAPAAAPSAAPIGSVRPPPTPIAQSVPRPALEFGEIFGQPDKKDWTLAEVTQRTAGLRGVAGAVLATPDGLLVAGTWSSGVKTEAVAAFIPQMYSRMIQCTKELKLGEPENFTLTIENVPLQIFKTGANYFTVLGRAGENLPKTQLNALAVRLALTQPAK